MEEIKTYRNIFKSSIILGSTQLFEIISLLIKSKIIAVLLGPSGMGLISLYNSTIYFSRLLIDAGLSITSVKIISEKYHFENENEFKKNITILKKLFIISGIIGMIILIILSPLLSKIIFESYEHVLDIVLISLIILILQVYNYQNAIFQGLNEIKVIAKTNFIGNFLSLVFTIPILFLFGVKGIPIFLLIHYLLIFVVNSKYIKSYNLQYMSKIYLMDLIVYAKDLIKKSYLISLSHLSNTLVTYLLRLFIKFNGNIAQVGFFSAGFLIINTYLGLIFSALNKDYYPRLSAISKNENLIILTVNRQAEIITLVISPMIMIFLYYIDFFLLIIYSKNFLVITEMMRWGILGVFFQVIGWCISYLILAKGDFKTYLFCELFASFIYLLLNVLGFILLNLEGLGIAFMINYISYFFQVYYIAKHKFNFYLNKNFLRIFLTCLSFSLILVLTMNLLENFEKIIICNSLILLATSYSLKELYKRLNF